MSQRVMEPGVTRGEMLARIPVTERKLELSGISTAILEGGSGPPLVLLHSPGAHAFGWAPVIPALAGTNRVIVPDLPGHGSTQMSGESLSAERVLDWLGELIDQTCSVSPTLVGHVLGGAIAARFAADQGKRVARLVLVDALGLVAFQPAPEFASPLTAYLGNPNEATYEALWRRCAYDVDRLRERMGDQWVTFRAYTLDRAHAPGAAAIQGALMEQFGFPPIPPEVLAGITVPTTLIWGRHDLATSLSVADAASARYGWPLQVIEDAGVDTVMEQPERFVQALRSVS
jgi:pimeloyl-ACP methyl ester carboxylesterase